MVASRGAAYPDPPPRPVRPPSHSTVPNISRSPLVHLIGPRVLGLDFAYSDLG